MIGRLLCIVWLAALFVVAPALAESEKSDEQLAPLSPERAEQAQKQDPEADVSPREGPKEYLDDLGLPLPCSGPYDWVRLNSGEWLRGRVYRMRRNELEYRSKKLKGQTVKWKDVSELCLPEPTRFVLEHHRIVIGRARLRGDVLTVTGSEGDRTVERREIIAILSGDQSEINRWRARASIGIDARTGNTKQTTIDSTGGLIREDSNSRAQLLYYGTYGTSNDILNVNKHRGDVKLDIFFSRWIYISAIDAILIHDEFQNIQFRAIPTAGLGWSVFDRPSFEWDLEAGGGYQFSNFIAGAPDEGDGVIRLGTRLQWDLISDLKFNATHDTILVVTNFGLTTYNTRATLSYELTDFLSLDFSIVHTRVREPVSDGERVPENDDLQMVFSLALERR